MKHLTTLALCTGLLACGVEEHEVDFVDDDRGSGSSRSYSTINSNVGGYFAARSSSEAVVGTGFDLATQNDPAKYQQHPLWPAYQNGAQAWAQAAATWWCEEMDPPNPQVCAQRCAQIGMNYDGDFGPINVEVALVSSPQEVTSAVQVTLPEGLVAELETSCSQSTPCLWGEIAINGNVNPAPSCACHCTL